MNAPLSMITDANVLIDLLKSEPDVIESFVKHVVGTVYVLRDILEEITDIENIEMVVKKQGISIIEPELEDTFEAEELRKGSKSTSFEDNLCFLTAKRRNLVCVTNDKQLRRLCVDSVQPLWGLELLLLLCQNKGILPCDAENLGQKIKQQNNRITEVIFNNFLKQLHELKEPDR